MRKNCPDCGADLGRNAFKCRCGWTESIKTEGVDLGVIYERFKSESTARWIEAGRPPAEDSIARIRAIANSPKPSPREHWQRVLEMRNPPHDAKETAERYLSRFQVAERIPGEDDEREAA